MKKKFRFVIICIFLGFIIQSCDSINESSRLEKQHNRRLREIRTKTVELEYLEKLYRVKSNIEFDHKMVKIDSLINEFENQNIFN